MNGLCCCFPLLLNWVLGNTPSPWAMETCLQLFKVGEVAWPAQWLWELAGLSLHLLGWPHNLSLLVSSVEWRGEERGLPNSFRDVQSGWVAWLLLVLPVPTSNGSTTSMERVQPLEGITLLRLSVHPGQAMMFHTSGELFWHYPFVDITVRSVLELMQWFRISALGKVMFWNWDSLSRHRASHVFFLAEILHR